MEGIIRQSLKNLSSCFEPNELAYLALTSKIEMPFRDRWAYSLHQKLARKGFIVSREWTKKRKRIDLVILQGRKPKALIQLKAIYTFDALDKKKFQKACKGLKSDLEKAKAAVSEMDKNPKIYRVLLATHPQPKVEIPEIYNGAIKYQNDINRVIKKKCNEQIEQNAKDKIQQKGREFLGRQVKKGEIDGGEAFGIPTKVLYWVWRKKIQ